jgi:stalled ribosome rescue protein Dom34
LKHGQRYRRGYPVAILVGLNEDRAVLWKVFSNVVKPEKTILLQGKWSDQKALYNFLELIVNALRPSLKEGIKSVILASPPRTSYARVFSEHVHTHHAWLTQGLNKVTVSEITGLATTLAEVAVLTRTSLFHKLVSETTQKETENVIDFLEERLNAKNQDSTILYSLKEAEDIILGQQKPGTPKAEYLLITDKYLSDSKERHRINRLIQIAANKSVKTTIIKSESTGGKRLTQLGGMVCIAKTQTDSLSNKN